VAAGERVFWVCPRIVAEEGAAPEGESRAESASAEQVFARLSGGALAAGGIALLHGALPSERRAAAIERFRSGAVHVLVATSMVEVGVDVPEATLMVIEGAERFGLAQLHQLRGRVGRSHRPSWCLLFGGVEGRSRLAFLERCDDGFQVAEEDLRQRGMGDLAGLRQAGENLEGLEDVELDLVRAARELVRADAALRAHYLGPSPGAALV
jgi:ATP-dependent DNA helicase RecG